MLGPIPARAGEPSPEKVNLEHKRAYPRSRGGTCFSALALFVKQGLSPLARGNLCPNHAVCLAPGPIPARAGEPIERGKSLCSSGAYPRSRGGTFGTSTLKTNVTGLSPLARGNRCLNR